MKQIKNIIIIFLIILVIGFSTKSFAKYIDIVYGKASADIKNPIFLVEKTDEIQGKISSINNNYYENYFNVLNYLFNDSSQIINEINFEYTIKIIPSTQDFPVKYSLINLNTNQEIALNSELETEKINLGTNLENHNYKLIVQWDMDNTNQNFEETLEIKVLVKGVQKI